MKLSAKDYATALYESTKGKSREEADEVIDLIMNDLVRYNRMKIAGDIIENFEKIYDKENEIIKAEVTSARKLSTKEEQEISEFLKEKYNAREVESVNVIDESLGGGVRIKVEDEVLDASLSRAIDNLRNNLIK